ncbi:MAG: spermidine synthase [Reyranellaceae bacterium]
MNELSAVRRFVVYLGVLVSGTVTMALEMLIGRTLTPYLGGTIYTWGALISVFLIGMTMGYFMGGRMADRMGTVHAVGALFIASAGLILLVPTFSEGVINTILDHVEDMRPAALLACLSFAFLPAMVLAAVSPLSLKLVLREAGRSGTESGRISGLATLGSIAGTLATSFFLIPSMGTQSIYYGLAIVAVIMAVIVMGVVLFDRPARAAGRVLVLALIGATLALALEPAAPASAQQLRVLKEGQIERAESEYNTIFIEKNGDQLSMAFGYRRNRYIESVLDLKDPDALAVVYTRYMTAAMMYPPQGVKSIALVGLGGGRTISYLVKSMPDVVAEVAELDGEVIRLARTYFRIEEGDRLKVHERDGRVFLAQTKSDFDVILVDAYRGPFVPFHLTTVEFYQAAKKRLRPGGVLAQNVEPTTLFFDSAYATMKAAFANVEAYPADGNVVLIGYDGPALTRDQLAERAKALQAKYKFRYDMGTLLEKRQTTVDAGKGQVLTDDFAPVEMLKTIGRHNQRKAE